MGKQNESIKCVYIVTCYQNIVGVYAEQDDASQCQRELISKARPADVLCRSIIYPLNAE